MNEYNIYTYGDDILTEQEANELLLHNLGEEFGDVIQDLELLAKLDKITKEI